jgi:hypothetical protein
MDPNSLDKPKPIEQPMPSGPHSPSAWTAAPEAEEFWNNRFHYCALAAGFIAAIENRLHDSYYVRDLAYRMYQEGAFRDRVRAVTPPPPLAARR